MVTDTLAPVAPTQCQAPTSLAPERPRPVQLQVRHTLGGPWHTVVCFDAGDDSRADFARTAAELLCSVDPSAHFRFVAQAMGALGVLQTYSAAEGWRTV